MPALLTLAVTLLRLAGELLHWSPRLFSREAGGPGALVGIVWLIPVFGAWLGLRLARAGDGPESPAKVLGWALLAFVLNPALAFGIAVPLAFGPIGQLALSTATSWIALAVARRGWPSLWRVLLGYAFAARLPVVVVMFFSIFGGWDTHYSKPRPDFPEMGPGGLFFWTGVLPQLGLWIWLTVVGGMFFGTLGALAARRKRG